MVVVSACLGFAWFLHLILHHRAADKPALPAKSLSLILVLPVPLSLVLCKLFGIDAAVAIQVEISKRWHLHAFTVFHAFVHTLVLFTHGFHVRLLPGRQLGFVQHAVAVGIEITEGWRGCGSFHRPAGFRHGRHPRIAERGEFLFTDESIAVRVKIRERRGAVLHVRIRPGHEGQHRDGDDHGSNEDGLECGLVWTFHRDAPTKYPAIIATFEATFIDLGQESTSASFDRSNASTGHTPCNELPLNPFR